MERTLAPERAREMARTRWDKATAPPAPIVRAVAPVDDHVREHHGVDAMNSGTVRIWEKDLGIVVRVWNGTTGTEQTVNPASARYLADRLYELARRIEQRKANR